MAVFVSQAGACSLCLTSVQQSITYRQEADRAHLVVYGTLTGSRLNADGSGTSQLRVEHVVKGDRASAPQTITVPRYVPIDPKEPPHYLFFCDTAGANSIPTGASRRRPRPSSTSAAARAVDPKDRSARCAITSTT
jgi:hypothetical protein